MFILFATFWDQIENMILAALPVIAFQFLIWWRQYTQVRQLKIDNEVRASHDADALDHQNKTLDHQNQKLKDIEVTAKKTEALANSTHRTALQALSVALQKISASDPTEGNVAAALVASKAVADHDAGQRAADNVEPVN